MDRGLSGLIAEESADTSPRRPLRRTLGGREDLMPVYRAAKDLLIDRKVWQLKHYEQEGRTKRLTICSTWRIEWDGRSAPRLYVYCYKSSAWKSYRSVQAWGFPGFAIAPGRMCTNDQFGFAVLDAAIGRALRNVGYDQLSDGHDYDWGGDRERAYRAVLEADRRKRVARRRFAHLWQVAVVHERRQAVAKLPIAKLSPKDGKAIERAMVEIGLESPVKPKRWLVELLRQRLLRPAKGGIATNYRTVARGLRNCFRENFVDHEVLSALVRLRGRAVDTNSYLALARSRGRDGLVRHARERPNAVPLAALFKESAWQRTDLFSKFIWLNATGASELQTLTATPHFMGLNDAASHRWLLGSPLAVVQGLMLGTFPHPGVLTLLAKAVQQAKADHRVPVVAVVHLARNLSTGWLGAETNLHRTNPDQVFRFYLLFLRESAARWAELGHRGLRLWLKDEGYQQVGAVWDYLRGGGIQERQPNHGSTWQSLLARSNGWHRAQQQLAEQGGRPQLTWESAIGEMEIGSYVFKPLCSSQELAGESNELEHCVWSYDTHCATGQYQVFAVYGPDRQRSTLGLTVGRNGEAAVQQHYGRFNAAVSKDAMKAGKALAAIYTDAAKG